MKFNTVLFVNANIGFSENLFLVIKLIKGVVTYGEDIMTLLCMLGGGGIISLTFAILLKLFRQVQGMSEHGSRS